MGAKHQFTPWARDSRAVRALFRELMVQFIQPRRRTECLTASLLLRLLDLLIEQYRVEIRPEDRDKLSSELRLQQIIQFVNRNYQSNLSLSRLAEELAVSTSTLSRFFKKQTGFYFVDYVNQVRVKAAMEELAESDENLTKVAVNSGFSNLTVFNRVFRDINGCSPTEFRRSSREAYQHRLDQEALTARQVREHLRRRTGQVPGQQTVRRYPIRVDGNSGVHYRKPWIQAINIGSAWQLTQANLQAHMLYLRDALGFRYARVWNVFSKGLMITDGQRVGGCSFEHLDAVLDFLVDNHITPYLDLGKRPNTITRNEEEVVFQEYEAVEFTSRRVWEYLMRSFIRHVVKRYGAEEVGGWLFELTYIASGRREDLLYLGEEPFDYVTAFRFFYETIREYVPQAQVGGAGSVSDLKGWSQREVFSRLVAMGCPPDFCSIAVYPYQNRGEYVLALRSREPEQEERQVEQTRAMLREVGLEQCRLFLCEWNCTLSNRNYLNDSCYRSACLLDKVVRLWGKMDMMALCMGSDWVDNHYDTYRIVNGNMGLIGQQNIRKPVFFAMQFLKSLGEYEICHQEHCIVTRTNHGSFYILCFNRKQLGARYYAMDEDRPIPSQIPELYHDQEPIELELELTGMPEGVVYTVKRRSINDREGSILPEWGRFRYDDQLEESDVRYLRDACFPRMSMERLAVSQGTLRIRECLRANEVSLLHIYRHNVIA